MSVLLSLQQVNKKYNHRLVLNSVNLDVYERQCLAIVGHNGSGKSTLLKIISGIILPSSGTVVKKREGIRLGYVPEKISYHLPFTPSEYLYHMGRINRLSKPYLTKRIQYLLNLFSLDDAKDSRMNKFSKGMQQKINMMQALLTEVDLLILDEPLSGLDPAAQQEFENILQHLKKSTTIIFSCHEQKLLNKVADRILTLNHQTICRDDLPKSKDDTFQLIQFMIENSNSVKSLINGYYVTMEQKEDRSHDLITVRVGQTESDQLIYQLIQKGASIVTLKPED